MVFKVEAPDRSNSLHLEAIKELACLLYPRGLDSMHTGEMEPTWASGQSPEGGVW